MLKKTIAFTDYNGVERQKDFYFNLTKTEVTEMELSEQGGLVKHIKAVIDSQDSREIFTIFKMIVLKSYGEKSPDGLRFVKSEELSTAFSQTDAFDVLIMSFFEDANLASEFMNGVIPKVPADQAKEISDAVNKQSLQNLK